MFTVQLYSPEMPRCVLLVAFLLLHVSASAHGGHDDGDAESSLILVKIWCLVLVFVGTFAGGISPCFMKWNEGLLVAGTQFAGGVFLGTAMMHFLSDSDASFKDLSDRDYPFAFMLACAGYLLTMFADFVIFYVTTDRSTNPTTDVELQGNTHNGGAPGGPGNGTCPHSHFQVYDRTEEYSTKPPLPTTTSLGDTILLISALCFHSIFEGIAVGVANTKSSAWRALWTVCLHKIFAAVAMGITLLRLIPGRPFLSCMAYSFAFAISTPLGVAIGIIVDATTEGVVADWIYAVSMGVACGVFVYVSINHLLSRGYRPQKIVSADLPHYKFLAVLLGVAVISVVMIWD